MISTDNSSIRVSEKLVRLYLFRVVPGKEVEVEKVLATRLAKGPEKWSFFVWFGRFDLVAITETKRDIDSSDDFLIFPEPLLDVFEVAEVIAFQLDIDDKSPTIGELISRQKEGPKGPLPLLFLTFLKLDHERLLDNKTIKEAYKFDETGRVIPYCWDTQISALKAIRKIANKLKDKTSPFELALGCGLGDEEIVAIGRFQKYEDLFNFLNECQELRVHSLLPEIPETTISTLKKAENPLLSHLFLSSITQTGIDFELAESIYKVENAPITFPGHDQPMQSILQCAGPRACALPKAEDYFPSNEWQHYEMLGEFNYAMISKEGSTITLGQFVRNWFKLRKSIGASQQGSTKDRTEISIIKAPPSVFVADEGQRPMKRRPLKLKNEEIFKKFNEYFINSPQERRAIEHILERCEALRDTSGSTLALPEFLNYGEKVQAVIERVVKGRENLEENERMSAKVLDEAIKLCWKNPRTREDSEKQLARLADFHRHYRDMEVLDLRSLTWTSLLFDQALMQRAGGAADLLLSAGFSARATTHLCSTSRLCLATSFLVNSLYELINEKLTEHGYDSVKYDGFVVFGRSEETKNVPPDVIQLPDYILWHPNEASILFHEIGHQLFEKKDIQRKLRRFFDQVCCHHPRDAKHYVALNFNDKEHYFIEIWADVFWCSLAYGSSSEDAKQFLLERLNRLERRHARHLQKNIDYFMARLTAVAAYFVCSERHADYIPLRAELIRYLKIIIEEFISSRGENAETWFCQFIKSYITQQNKLQELADNFSLLGMILAETVKNYEELRALLSLSGSSTFPEQAKREMNELIRSGRIPGVNFFSKYQNLLPLTAAIELMKGEKLEGVNSRLALAIWLYDLYCKKVIGNLWKKVAQNSHNCSE